MFYLVTALCYLIFVAFFLVPLPIRRGFKLLLALLTAPIAFWGPLCGVLFANRFSPEVPKALIVLMGWGGFTLLLMVVTLLPVFLLLWGWRLLRRRRLRGPVDTAIRVVIALAAALLSAHGVRQGIGQPQVKSVSLQLADLPPALDGLKVVQLSDIHISRMLTAEWARQMVAQVNALQPDLILITGDSVDGSVAARAQAVSELGALHARYGVFMAPGNHEYYYGLDGWMQQFQSLGIHTLVNQHASVQINGAELVLAGVADPAALPRGLPGPDVTAALHDVAPEAMVVLLRHRPIPPTALEQTRIDLQLSGHTHGGMVAGLKQIVAKANDGYVTGLYTLGPMQLYVNNGTGVWNGFPIRLGAPAEITEFTLRR